MTRSESGRLGGLALSREQLHQRGSIGGRATARKLAEDPDYFRKIGLRAHPYAAARQRVMAMLKTKPIGSL